MLRPQRSCAHRPEFGSEFSPEMARNRFEFSPESARNQPGIARNRPNSVRNRLGVGPNLARNLARRRLGIGSNSAQNQLEIGPESLGIDPIRLEIGPNSLNSEAGCLTKSLGGPSSMRSSPRRAPIRAHGDATSLPSCRRVLEADGRGWTEVGRIWFWPLCRAALAH